MTKLYIAFYNFKRWGDVILIVFLCASTALLVINIYPLTRALSFDEALTAHFLDYVKKYGYSWQLEREIGIIHDPLFFFTLFLFDGFVSRYNIPIEVEIRMLSFLFHIFTIPFIYLIGRFYDRFIGILGATIYALSPFAIAHALVGYRDSFSNLLLSISIYTFMLFINCKSPLRRVILVLLSGGIMGLTVHSRNYLIIYYLFTIMLSVYKFRGQRDRRMLIIAYSIASLLSVLFVEWIVTGTPITFFLCYEERLIYYAGAIKWVMNPTYQFNNLPIVVIGLFERFTPTILLLYFIGILILRNRKDYKEILILFIFPSAIFLAIFSAGIITRYLLNVLPFITIISAHVIFMIIKQIVKRNPMNTSTGFVVLLVLFLIISPGFFFLEKLPSASVVDDRIFRDSLREASLLIKNKYPVNETWVLTNTQHSVIRYYSGFHTRWFISFTTEGLMTYSMYDPFYRKIHVTRFITAEEEEKMKFVILEDYNYTGRDFLFSNPSVALRSNYNDIFLRYLSKYYSKVTEFVDKGRTVLYQRTSNNTFLLKEKPTIYIGETSAYYDYENETDIFSYNGWIYGKGWSPPLPLNTSEGIIWVRKAQRTNFDFPPADFVLTIPDTRLPSKLQIEYFDDCYGRVHILTYIDRSKSKLLATISLNSTLMRKSINVIIEPSLYFDASSSIAYHQQYFMLITEGCNGFSVIRISMENLSVGSSRNHFDKAQEAGLSIPSIHGNRMHDPTIWGSVIGLLRTFNMYTLRRYFRRILAFNIKSHNLFAGIYSYGLSYARYVEYAISIHLLHLLAKGGNIVIDIGSGKSIFPSLIRSVLKKDVICIDISKEALIEQRNRGNDCIRASGTHLPFRENSIDFATSISTIEHIPDDGDLQVAKEVGRVVKKGAIFSVPFSIAYRCISDEFYGIPSPFKLFKSIIRGLFIIARLERRGFIQRYYDVERLHKIFLLSKARSQVRFFFGSKMAKIIYKVVPIGLITPLEYFVALSLEPNYEDFVIIVLLKETQEADALARQTEIH